MYLHVGKGRTVKKKKIIGIFDLDTSTVSSVTKGFINKNEKSGLVEYADFDLPRSFVLCEEKRKYKIILSRISSFGLKERVENNSETYYE